MNLIVRKVLAVVVILVVMGFLMAYVVKDQDSRASDATTGTTTSADPSTSGSDATTDADSSNDSDSPTPFAVFPADKQQVAPDFTLKTADGAPFTLSHAVKRGYVILDFWASYCGPCKMELPDYESLYKKYGPKGVQFYTVNSSDTPETIKMFATSIGLTMPMLVDADGSLASNYGVDAIPLTIVIDRRRKVVAGSMGYDPNMTQDLPVTLDKLIAQKS